MAVDSSGNVIIVGNTSSADLSTKLAYQAAFRGGQQDGFVAKFGPTGTFLYGSYLGGTGSDFISAVAVDSVGNIFVAGQTFSTDFPKISPYQTTLKGSSDGFLTKIAADGASLLFSTYLGGTNNDAVNALIRIGWQHLRCWRDGFCGFSDVERIPDYPSRFWQQGRICHSIRRLWG